MADLAGLSIHLTWADVAARLALACLAGGLIGLNREQQGHSAGLRTTLLVCLAAAVAMIQADLLLPLAGKPSDGFSVMDLMRLPLGILTGMGFIGAGAVVRRGDLVVGVTTAATLWITTVIGLCFGGGQLVLGVVSTALALVILLAVKALDRNLHRVRRGELLVVVVDGQPVPHLDTARLKLDKVEAVGLDWRIADGVRTLRYKVQYQGPPSAMAETLDGLAHTPGVLAVRWSGLQT